jgi:hypothetical protein
MKFMISHTSHAVWFSKKFAIIFAWTIGSKMGSKGPRITDGTFGPPLFARDFAISHIACGVTSQVAIFVSHHSSALLVSRPPPFEYLQVRRTKKNMREYFFENLKYI